MSCNKIFYLVLITFIITSCVTNKNVIYFQDVKSEACIESNSLNYTPTFHTDDLLSITVSSLDIESTTPFNIQMNKYN